MINSITRYILEQTQIKMFKTMRHPYKYIFLNTGRVFIRKHSTRQFYKIFEKAPLEYITCSNEIVDKDLLENLICSYGIFSSWKIVLAGFLESPPGNVFQQILPLLEKLICCYKRIMSSPEKFICFLIASKPPRKFNVFQKFVLKSRWKKRTDILAK